MRLRVFLKDGLIFVEGLFVLAFGLVTTRQEVLSLRRIIRQWPDLHYAARCFQRRDCKPSCRKRPGQPPVGPWHGIASICPRRRPVRKSNLHRAGKSAALGLATGRPAKEPQSATGEYTGDSCGHPIYPGGSESSRAATASVLTPHRRNRSAYTRDACKLTAINNHHPEVGDQLLTANVQVGVGQRRDTDDVGLADLRQEARHHLVEFIVAQPRCSPCA